MCLDVSEPRHLAINCWSNDCIKFGWILIAVNIKFKCSQASSCSLWILSRISLFIWSFSLTFAAVSVFVLSSSFTSSPSSTAMSLARLLMPLSMSS